MISRHHQNKEFNAVVRGRIDELTIFSSWVMGCRSVPKAVFTMVEAREYLKTKGMMESKEVIKDGAGGTTLVRDMPAFYAVAYGEQSGIYPFWQYEVPAVISYRTMLTNSSETELKVKEHSGACHKRFETLSQAEALNEDRKDSVVWRAAIREELDHGLRPGDMRLSVQGIPSRHGKHILDADALDMVKLDKLSLKEKK